MTPDKALFEKLDFSFKLEGNAEMISVIPCIELDSDRDHTLIVSFYVDSMEMIESARVAVSKGWNRIPLTQPVRIRRPLLWHPNGGKGIPSLYSFTAVFHHDGKPFYMIEKRCGIRFVSCIGEKVSVNGNEISLSSFDPDFQLEEKEFDQRYSGNSENLIFLTDSDPELEMKLERCGKAGIMVVLELTGKEYIQKYKSHPCVCLFTASAGHGEKIYRQLADESGNPVPFLQISDMEKFIQ